MAEPYPTVRLDTSALDAARLLAERRLPGLIVVDDHDHPIAVLPGSQFLRLVIPHYVQDDPTLARVLDEAASDRMCAPLAGRTVADLLPKDRPRLPVVQQHDTGMEIAAIMAGTRSPLVAVVADKSRTAPLIGAVSVSRLLSLLLPAPE
ncbi:MAG: CBS domain-containing protein [Streptosporangiaceae bacterium]